MGLRVVGSSLFVSGKEETPSTFQLVKVNYSMCENFFLGYMVREAYMPLLILGGSSDIRSMMSHLGSLVLVFEVCWH